MKVLVIGAGGREHALVWKLSQSAKINKLYCIPGNAGIARIACCRNFSLNDFSLTANFVRQNKIDLTIVGPELPLVDGIVDYFQSEGLSIFGPGKRASLLEGSKAFAKQLMKKYAVPTAPFSVFTQAKEAIKYVQEKGFPLVIKADGLAGGKGAVVARDENQAKEAIIKMLETQEFGQAGKRIVIEDYLEGEEASMLAFVDGRNILPLVSSQDHKQVGDNDQGPNTGGMGAYAPAPLINEELSRKIYQEVFLRMLEAIEKEGISYQGILYAGLMICEGHPYVLEFNVRFGDPETQAILPLLENDLIEVILATEERRLGEIKLSWKEGCALCCVLASGGYPGEYKKGEEIRGLEESTGPHIIIFHSGTSQQNGKFFTNGGRVLGVTALADDIRSARERAYQAINKINFNNMHYRRDIGLKALRFER